VFFLALGAALGQVQISLLHFNDFHARYEPITGGGGACKPGENEQGTSNSANLMDSFYAIFSIFGTFDE